MWPTRQALQKTRGDLSGGSEVLASAVLSISATASLQELKEEVHRRLRIPVERQLLLQIADVSQAGFSPWLLPVQSMANLQASAMCHGCSIMPTVLLMFLSNDADLESLPSMLQWVPGSGLPQLIPLLCRYFSHETMNYTVLGVLLVAPTDSLSQHLPWLQKRIAVAGEEPSAALASYESLGPGQETLISSSSWLRPLRMDLPLIQQQPGSK